MSHEGDGIGRSCQYTDGKADERTGLREEGSVKV